MSDVRTLHFIFLLKLVSLSAIISHYIFYILSNSSFSQRLAVDFALPLSQQEYKFLPTS